MNKDLTIGRALHLRTETLKAARAFIQRELNTILESVCTKADDGKVNLQEIDPHAVPHVRSYQRILAKIDRVLSSQ